MFRSLSLVLLLLLSTAFKPADDWTLEKDKDGIRVYTRIKGDRRFKEFRAVTQVNASLTSVVALVRDSEAAPEWYNHVESGELLKIFNEKSSIVHLKLDFPFPATNRDLVAKFEYEQDPETKIVRSKVVGMPDYIPEKDGFIRIKELEGSWQFTPLEKNLVEVQYQFYADPGGNLPVWAVNMFIVDDPFKSLKRMQRFVDREKYQNMSISFIEE